MFTETFKYKDYNGVEREETHYFDLNAPEVVDLNFSEAGGLKETLIKLKSEQNIGAIIEIMQTIIKRSIGQKSLDGRNFRKSKEITDDFVSTPMYPQFYMKLATDPKYFAKFLGAITPRDIPENVNADFSEEDLMKYINENK